MINALDCKEQNTGRFAGSNQGQTVSANQLAVPFVRDYDWLFCVQPRPGVLASSFDYFHEICNFLIHFTMTHVSRKHAALTCDICHRVQPRDSSFSYTGLNTQFENICRTCESRRVGRDQQSVIYERFSTSLFPYADSGAVNGIDELFTRRWNHEITAPLEFLTELDKIMSGIPVALLYAVAETCVHYSTQANFASVMVELEFRAGAAKSFGSFFAWFFDDLTLLAACQHRLINSCLGGDWQNLMLQGRDVAPNFDCPAVPDGLNISEVCCVCLDRKPYLVWPCFHVNTCMECLDTILRGVENGRRCPLCRTDFSIS